MKPNDLGRHFYTWNSRTILLAPKNNDELYVELLQEKLVLHMTIHQCTLIMHNTAA